MRRHAHEEADDPYLPRNGPCEPFRPHGWRSTETALWPAYDPNTGLWGYIDAQGAWGIAPEWERAYHFHGGCAIVDTKDVPSWQGESTQGIIDENGAYLLVPEYHIDDACCFDGAGALYLVDRYGEERSSGWFNIPNRYFSGLYWTECYAWQETPYILVNDDYSVSGLADRATGEIIVPMEYSYTGLYDWGIEDGVLVAERADTGECELIEVGVGPVALPEGVYLDYVVGVAEGMVPFCAEDGSQGYLNTAGEIVIEAIFSAGSEFRDGYADVVLPDGTDAVIDRSGTVVFTGHENYFGLIAGALFVEWSDDTWGLVEPDGTIRCRHTLPEGAYDVWLWEFSPDGPIWLEYALGDDEYLWGLMSRDGELLGEPRWSWMSHRAGELWLVVSEDAVWDWSELAGSWYYVDAYGNPVLPFEYADAEPFSGPLARVRFDETTEGYINRSGETVYQWPSPGDEW